MSRVHLISAYEGAICEFCGGSLQYSMCEQDERHWGYDALFCPACDAWREPACPEPGCSYCAERPVRPSGCNYPRKRFEPAPTLDAPAEDEGFADMVDPIFELFRSLKDQAPLASMGPERLGLAHSHVEHRYRLRAIGARPSGRRVGEV